VLYRTLGRTGLRVSVVGLGTGGPSRLGQRTHRDEAQARRVVRRALDLGVNLFDTAADYGDSEALLGHALRGVPRDHYLLATKCAPARADGSLLTPAEFAASCEHSLERLGVETIDLFQFHSVLPQAYRAAVDRLYPIALRLREQGKVRFLGITEYFFADPAHAMLGLALADDVWDVVMVKYGILNLSAEKDVLPMAAARNVGVLNMSPVRVKMTRADELEKQIARWKAAGRIPRDALPERSPLDFLVHGGVDSVISAGYKFGIGHPAVTAVLIGTGSVAHLEANIAAVLGPPLPEADTDRIRALFGGLAESEGDCA
jgi:aryl-alcohol dehydrogenase-like predicted oxidoreductase